jgi:hypothetical protein
MRRVIVAGGAGFFGRTVLELLSESERKIPALAASRRSGDLRMDVENRESLRGALRPGDVVTDTVGPFQDRSTTLIEAAMEIGCDVIDLSDSLAYARRIDALAARIETAGIRVLPSCSSVSAISAWLVRQSGIAEPVRVTGFLAPAAHYSASPSTADSLLRSIGRDVEVWRHAAWVTRPGWLDRRTVSLPAPIGTLQGHLFETADSFWLPRIWPGLETADYYIDTRTTGLNSLLSLAARSPFVRRWVQRLQAPGHRLARLWGPKTSCLAVEVEAADGTLSRQALHSPDRGYRLAALPAALAARAMREAQAYAPGIVSPREQLTDTELRTALKMLEIALTQS